MRHTSGQKWVERFMGASSLGTTLVIFWALSFALGMAAQTLPAALQKPLQQWKSAIEVGDSMTEQALYSTNPPARVFSTDGKEQFPVSEETGFWQQLLSSGMRDVTMKVMGAQEQKGLQVVALELAYRVSTPHGPRQRYVIEQQGWLPEPGGWRIVVSTHTPVLKMRPIEKLTSIYDAKADARAEIAEAVKKAAATHKRVLLMFGGDWCYDCHILDAALHQPDIAPLAQRFVIVHIDIGTDGKKNNDVAAKYHVPLEKGVPALVVLSGTGTMLYSQQHGEFEKARDMDPDDLIAFLKKWEPGEH